VGELSATTGETHGVVGVTNSTETGRGVIGWATATSGSTYGVYGRSSSTSGTGAYGYAVATSGNTYGVFGQSNSTSGTGVSGYAVATSGYTYGVFGGSQSSSGTGVLGRASATSGFAHGVYGESNSTSGFGVMGLATASSGTTCGVRGLSSSTSGTGVYGRGSASSGVTYGVYGEVDSPGGYAGYFNGDTHVAGTLTKTSGSFKIDHPLEPDKKYLYHSFVESPDMMNIYNGNVSLDEKGEAQVELPAWFEALNRDFRYQLTTVGGFAPVYIAEQIRDNRFKIAGGEPGMVVSWLVTGIRQDAWAEAHPISVEEDKPEDEVGTYLHPEELGFDKKLGLDYQRNAALGKPLESEVGSPEENR
jgi:hypothetical protein